MRTGSSEPQADLSLAQRRMILDACAQVGAGPASSQPTVITPSEDVSGSLGGSGEAFDDFAPGAFPGYRIERRLHEGGQGVVYLALQLSTQRQVAIKVTRHGPLATADERTRFEREVRILGQLNHPHIVAIHDCGRIIGCDYFVMDFVQGQPLDAFVRKGQPGIRETLALFAQVCDAVNAAHLRGIIHRDLKPGNILVTEGIGDQGSGIRSLKTPIRDPRSPSPEPEPKILDFGLARMDASSTDDPHAPSLTESGAFVGSVPWASPEQARRGALDIRTDVYSLGVILYQSLTGQMPYSMAGGHEDVLSRIIHLEPLRPTTLNRGLDAELETILLKCLQKEPERRYQSAGELSREIGRYLRGEPIEAKRDSLAYVLGKYIKRHRGRAAAAVISASAVIAALVVSVTYWQIAQTQRDKAVREASAAQFSRRVLFSGIGGAMPESGASGMSAEQLLDRFADQVDKEVKKADDPRAEAPVRTVLGIAYRSIGKHQKSHAQLDRALQLWQLAEFSDAPEELAKASDEKGLTLQAEHQHDEAEKWHRKALTICSGMPQQPELRARFLANVGNCLAYQRRLPEARQFLRDSLDIYAGLDSSQALASADVMDNLGKVAERAGDMKEAEAWLRKAIAIRDSISHAESTAQATSLQNLGVLMLRIGDAGQAASLASSALEIRRQVFPGDHAEVASSLSLLGLAWTAENKPKEAEPVLRESLEMRIRLYPESHAGYWSVGQARSALGGCMMKQPDRLAEAEDLLLSGYETLKGAPRAPPKLLCEAAERLAALYEIRQDADQAEHWRDVATRYR